MNQRDFRHLAGNKTRITTSRDDGNFFAWKLLRFDSRQNLPNQSTVTEDGTTTHCLNSRPPDGAGWLFQRQPRQQRSPLIKKICHRFDSGRNHAADVSATFGNHIEGRCRAKIDNNGGASVKFGHSRGIRQAIGSYRFGSGIINRDTQFLFPIQPEHWRFVVSGL